jgi:hypothetical protein
MKHTAAERFWTKVDTSAADGVGRGRRTDFLTTVAFAAMATADLD